MLKVMFAAECPLPHTAFPCFCLGLLDSPDFVQGHKAASFTENPKSSTHAVLPWGIEIPKHLQVLWL